MKYSLKHNHSKHTHQHEVEAANIGEAWKEMREAMTVASVNTFSDAFPKTGKPRQPEIWDRLHRPSQRGLVV